MEVGRPTPPLETEDGSGCGARRPRPRDALQRGAGERATRRPPGRVPGGRRRPARPRGAFGPARSPSGATGIIPSAVDSLGHGPTLVVGHSLGGHAALEFARCRPERLRGLILAGAGASPRGPGAVPYRWAAEPVSRPPADRPARWNDRLLRWLSPPEVVEATIRSGYAFHTLPAARGEVLGRFGPEAMRSVKAPVLVLNGEKDAVFRSGEADFARAHPHARVESIPRTGHLANFDAPDAFTDAVRRFARRLPAAGRPRHHRVHPAPRTPGGPWRCSATASRVDHGTARKDRQGSPADTQGSSRSPGNAAKASSGASSRSRSPTAPGRRATAGGTFRPRRAGACVRC
ncbi:Pimeloyl-ACP methyl ester carboxylesterase [Streptomyces prasinopilosus]|uniref:Pimeloyl-ACP methyl ester carboxylesterase n=1 Tax=Streptomyces prasinopilosus TaxID=67344 RepID=A0A1G6IET9_9ACTN|nr:Pimeloyl-ACP methyl ester carboxylesterase [Streptomyces prasinopilosus]